MSSGVNDQLRFKPLVQSLALTVKCYKRQFCFVDKTITIVIVIRRISKTA